MGTQINNFEVTNYTTTKLKIKATTAKVPEIMNDVSTISNQLTTITEELKKLVEEDIQSSDFVSETNNIITVSNNINAALATTMKSLINDAYERILKISDESKAFQNDLSEASNAVKKSLDELDGIGNKKVGRISSKNDSTQSTPVENQDSTDSTISGSAGTETPASADNTTTMPDGTVATTETVEAPTAMATPEPQQVEIITQDPQPAPTPAATGNASSNAETAATLGISEAQLETVKAVIRHEAGENPQEMINVASCLKNRMNAGNWGGTDPYSVVTANGQFESYYGGHYKQYENGNYYSGDDRASVDQQINAILLGQQAPTHNYQSFRASSSPNGVQLSEGGNKYR